MAGCPSFQFDQLRTVLGVGVYRRPFELGNGMPSAVRTPDLHSLRLDLRQLARMISELGKSPSEIRHATAGVTSSVITLKPASVHGPNEVTIATSVASRRRQYDAARARPARRPGSRMRASHRLGHRHRRSVTSRCGSARRHADPAELFTPRHRLQPHTGIGNVDAGDQPTRHRDSFWKNART